MKTGILLVTVGTSSEEGRRVFSRLDLAAKARFPGVAVRWAYTSPFARRKLATRGELLDSPKMALVRMHEEGFTHVAVQSLQVAAGTAYHDLARTVSVFQSEPHAFEGISLGKPLLVGRADLDAVVEAVLGALPERGAGDAVVLMGHGDRQGHSDRTFLAAAAAFHAACPTAYLGTLQGQPTLHDVLARLRETKPDRALLVPFMSVAGNHARNDLAGDGETSWKSAISALGIDCMPVLKGIAEYADVVTVWMDHLATALEGLGA